MNRWCLLSPIPRDVHRERRCLRVHPEPLKRLAVGGRRLERLGGRARCEVPAHAVHSRVRLGPQRPDRVGLLLLPLPEDGGPHPLERGRQPGARVGARVAADAGAAAGGKDPRGGGGGHRRGQLPPVGGGALVHRVPPLLVRLRPSVVPVELLVLVRPRAHRGELRLRARALAIPPLARLDVLELLMEVPLLGLLQGDAGGAGVERLRVAGHYPLPERRTLLLGLLLRRRPLLLPRIVLVLLSVLRRRPGGRRGLAGLDGARALLRRRLPRVSRGRDGLEGDAAEVAVVMARRGERVVVDVGLDVKEFSWATGQQERDTNTRDTDGKR